MESVPLKLCSQRVTGCGAVQKLGALLLLIELFQRHDKSEEDKLLPLPMLRLDLRSNSRLSMCCRVSGLTVAELSRLASPLSAGDTVCN
jgi:hypothetical protein